MNPPPGDSGVKGESDSRAHEHSSEPPPPPNSNRHPLELRHPTTTPSSPSTQPSTSTSTSPAAAGVDLDSIWESMVKVTLASFGGSLVGLALENQRTQQLAQQQPHATEERPQQPDPRATTRRRQRPPTRGSSWQPPPNRTAAAASASPLPGQWALSCLFFAAAMEASRHASPTTLFFRLLTEGPGSAGKDSSGDDKASTLFSRPAPDYRTVFLTSLGDYAIGGAASGTAGGWALASRRAAAAATGPAANMPMGFVPSHRRAPFTKGAGLVWGLRVGAALGVAAGIAQAAVDVAGLYYDETQQQQQHYHPHPAANQSSSQLPQVPSARGSSVDVEVARGER